MVLMTMGRGRVRDAGGDAGADLGSRIKVGDPTTLLFSQYFSLPSQTKHAPGPPPNPTHLVLILPPHPRDHQPRIFPARPIQHALAPHIALPGALQVDGRHLPLNHKPSIVPKLPEPAHLPRGVQQAISECELHRAPRQRDYEGEGQCMLRRVRYRR